MEEIKESEIDYRAYAKTHELNNGAAYLRNIAENYPVIKSLLNRREASMPIYGDDDNFGHLGPAIITASGASLDRVKSKLNELRNNISAKLFSAPSQVWGLVEAGVIPDYVVGNDMWPGTGRYCPRVPDWKKIAKRIVPIAHPGVWPEFLHWPGFDDRGLLYSIRHAEGSGKPKAPEEMSEDEKNMQKWVFMGMPECYFPNALTMASILLYANNPDLKYPIKNLLYLAPDTTLQCAMVAVMMGYDPLYLVGYDLCFWNGLTRARTINGDGSAYDGDVFTGIAQETESGFAAAQSMLYYRTITLLYQAKLRMRLVDVVIDKTPGNLQYLPRVDFDDLLQGEPELALKSYEETKLDYDMPLKLFFKKNGLVVT